MNNCKIVLILVFLLLVTKLYSQDNKSDSLGIQRESLNGYFSHNKLFCDKLEEFIDLHDRINRYPAHSHKLILINIVKADCKCEPDSLYTIRVAIKNNSFIFGFLNVNVDEIYFYGGTLKDRYIFIIQKSIFGKLFRSEFNFIDELEKIDPIYSLSYAEKYYENMNEGCINVDISFPQMCFFVNRNGDVIDVKYYQNDVRGFVTYDNINDYEKSFFEPIEYVPKSRRNIVKP